jgi:hypothetical protein
VYLEAMKIMRHEEMTTLSVNFKHVEAFSSELRDTILKEFYRFEFSAFIFLMHPACTRFSGKLSRILL